MGEAEYRAKMDFILCELGVSYSTRSNIIEAKVKDCEDNAYYHNRSLEEEFERDIESMGEDKDDIFRSVIKSHGK